MAKTGSEPRGSAIGDSILNPMDGAITSPAQRTPTTLVKRTRSRVRKLNISKCRTEPG